MSEHTQSKAAVARCAFCGKLNRLDLSRLRDGPKCAECHRPIRLDRPVKVTDADFDTVLAGTEAPGGRGLLCRLVRAVPDDGADPG
jgi:hypothetical protein